MTTITIERELLEQALDAIQELEHASTAVADKKARDAKSNLRAALAAPATAPAMQLRQGECWPESTMAQWDYYRKLIANGDTSSAPRDWFEGLADMRLIPAPATAPERCWCDEQNIGEPGVSCGDCPTRDYKHPATAPAWHDEPTCAGVWVCNYGELSIATVNQPDIDAFDPAYNAGGRWYGPIPEDKR